MASAGPAAGRGASTATAPAGSGWHSGIPAMASVGSGTRTGTDQCPRRAGPSRDGASRTRTGDLLGAIRRARRGQGAVPGGTRLITARSRSGPIGFDLAGLGWIREKGQIGDQYRKQHLARARRTLIAQEPLGIV